MGNNQRKPDNNNVQHDHDNDHSTAQTCYLSNRKRVYTMKKSKEVKLSLKPEIARKLNLLSQVENTSESEIAETAIETYFKLYTSLGDL